MAQSKVKLVELQGSGNAKEPVGKADLFAFLTANPKAQIALTGSATPLTRDHGKRASIFGVMATWESTAIEFARDPKVVKTLGGGMGDLLIGLNGSKKNGFASYIKLVA